MVKQRSISYKIYKERTIQELQGSESNKRKAAEQIQKNYKKLKLII
ncbi:hypothetical protein pb186bvf_002849 [Paramecium bursaria]